MNTSKNRKDRIRRKARLVSSRPRLSYEKSNRFMSFQLIDDKSQKTIFGVHQKQVKGKDKQEVINQLAEKIAKLMQEHKVKEVYLDRGSRKYQGNLVIIIDKLRKSGIKV